MKTRLPTSLIAALGLTGCTATACLTAVGPCLGMEMTDDTDPGSDSDTDSSTDASEALRDVLERDVLPADVAERLRRRKA